jgi:hypothetical protein
MGTKNKEMDKAKEVFSNSSAPYWPGTTTQGGGTLVIGNAQVIAMEVVVSKLLRWLLRSNQSSILYLISIHTASQALLGGFSGFFDDVKYSSASPTTVEAFMDGAKGIPGLFAAQYVINTGLQGLHFPGFSFKDMLITGASKALTRPIINLAYDSLPVALQTNFAAHDEMFNKQKTIARFKSK